MFFFCPALLIVTTVSPAADVQTVCKTAADCYLNGDCVSGVCKCDAAWSTSPDCSTMSFLEQDKNHRPGYYNKTESAWGGLPIQDETTKKWHLFHAQMANHCGLNSWTTNSIVARSVSSTQNANGPYTFESEVLPPFAHNPTIRKVSDGYAIWFIGGWGMNASHCNGSGEAAAAAATLTSKAHWDANLAPISAGGSAGGPGGGGASATCNGQSWDKSCGPHMPGLNKDCCGPCDSPYHANCGCGIATAHAATLDGPWKVQHVVITDQWESDDVYCTHTNPSPFVMANGTIVMAFNAGYCNNHLETIGLAVSDGGWAGPWRLLVKNSILKNPDGSAHKCEDPFVWQSKRGWHLIVHNQEGNFGNSESAYAFSEDGHSWTLAKTAPYDCTIKFTDGTTATASGCGNRPQILFGDDGAPQLLTNGAFAANPNGGKNTYTLFRPLTTTIE